MKTLYLDLFSGISGDMFIGALLDLGVPLAELEQGLARLGLGGFCLHAAKQQRGGIAGTKFEAHLAGPGPDREHHHAQAEFAHHDQERAQAGQSQLPSPAQRQETSRDFGQIRQLLRASGLSPWVKERAVAVFERMAVAEGKIHGQPPEAVHFHEVGAIDSLVDVVGACLALESLGPPRVLASPIVDGMGWIVCAHGRLPLPAPATLEILAARGLALAQCEEPHELVTPTGAALLAEFVESLGPMPALRVERIAYGLGSREHLTRPNALRVVLGESAQPGEPLLHDWETDTVAVLETNLDDISPELLGSFVEQALAAGALDVFYTPVQMKKSRPGVLLTVLCEPAAADRLAEQILRETTAFGVRRSEAERRKLRREFRQVSTPFGEVTVKVGLLNGRVLQAAPEYESCRQVAAQGKLPLKQVYEAAIRALGNFDAAKR
jgi:hypothetical protein